MNLVRSSPPYKTVMGNDFAKNFHVHVDKINSLEWFDSP